ncbi:hypothetical protein, partial [Phaeodactylibacter luteus]|uniref:hypothetical protein n=1 Tax=Phaeodactylibacter luteus TaxID=1564516 RepID=UPI00147933A5
CEGELAGAQFLGGEALGPNDTLFFALHTGSGNALGDTIATSPSPQFGLLPGMQYGQAYYISAVATNILPGGAPALESACLSVSIGTPVAFYPQPQAAFMPDTAVCPGQPLDITVSGQGGLAFDIFYTENGAPQQGTAQALPFSFPFNGSSSATFVLDSITAAGPASCTAAIGDTLNVTILQQAFTDVQEEICEGGSIFIAGA